MVTRRNWRDALFKSRARVDSFRSSYCLFHTKRTQSNLGQAFDSKSKDYNNRVGTVAPLLSLR